MDRSAITVRVGIFSSERWGTVPGLEAIERPAKRPRFHRAVPVTARKTFQPPCLIRQDGCDYTGPRGCGHDYTDEGDASLNKAVNVSTSVAGVFAVGDVRAGNIKRVASSVGEGAIAVAFVHQALHE